MFKARRERASQYLKRAGYAEGGPATAKLTFGAFPKDKAKEDAADRAVQKEYDDGAGGATNERDPGERAVDPSSTAQFDRQLGDTIMKAPDTEGEAKRGGRIKRRR